MVFDWWVLLVGIRLRSRQGILHAGKAMVGEEEPVRERCLVQVLALALGEIG